MALQAPAAVTLETIAHKAGDNFREWLEDRRNRRAFPHRMQQAGYEPVRNPAAANGLYVIGGRRQVIYAKADIALSERHRAAADLVRGARTGRTIMPDSDVPF